MTALEIDERGVPRVLVFCRPYLIGDFKENIAPLGDKFDMRFLTDGRSPGIRDTRERFYALLGRAHQSPGFSAEDERDVLERCRYLRNLPRQQAFEMLRAMAAVLHQELEQFNPHAVLSHMVDDYVTHLLAELSKRRGIPFIGYAYSYFPDKAQVTRFGYGEPLDGREPAEEEVTQVLDQISQRTFRQNYLQPETYTTLRHLKAMLRYRVKQIVFRYRAWRDRDPLHMHYKSLPFIVERRRWADFPSLADFHADWRSRLESRAAKSSEPIVYFPLGYFPEATIDYWIEDRRVLDYEAFVLQVCRSLGAKFRVVVKEHMHMLGARNPEFYRVLRDIPGVVSVPPLEFSNDVLSMADIVLMGAGSIGVEAFIRGKPIVSFCKRSYWFGHAGARFLDPAHIDAWPDLISDSLRTRLAISHQDRVDFIRACLRSTMRQRGVGRYWPLCDENDLQKMLTAALGSRLPT